MRNTLRLTALASIAVLIVAACGSSSVSPSAQSSGPAASAPAASGTPSESAPPAGGPQSGGILRMARDTDVEGWDPLFASSNPTLWAMPLVYGSLNFPNADATDLDPDIATSWEVNPNGREITYHLRDGLKNSDGTPFTAADAVFSIDRVAHDPESPWPDLLPAGLVATAPDDTTVVVTTPGVAPSMLSDLTMVRLYSKAYFEKVGKEGIASAPLGTGPFMLKEWERGEVAHLVRNPNYWDQPRPYLDGVDLMVVPDANTRALKLQANEIDITIDLPLTAAEELATNKDITIVSKPLKSSAVMMMNEGNPDQPWFKDLKVRQAINYAIDKQAIIDGALHGFAIPMTSVLSIGQYVDPNGKPWPYDLAKAKELMSQSGYPQGFTTTLTVRGSDPVFVDAATIIKSNLEAIGITVNLEPLDAAAARAVVVTPAGGATTTYSMALIYAWTNETIDQGYIFGFCCVGEKGLNDSNRTFFDDPAIDALWHQAQTEGDPAKRAEDFTKLQAMVWEAAPFAFLWNGSSRSGTRATVHDFTITSTSYHPLTAVWISTT